MLSVLNVNWLPLQVMSVGVLWSCALMRTILWCSSPYNYGKLGEAYEYVICHPTTMVGWANIMMIRDQLEYYVTLVRVNMCTCPLRRFGHGACWNYPIYMYVLWVFGFWYESIDKKNHVSKITWVCAVRQKNVVSCVWV